MPGKPGAGFDIRQRTGNNAPVTIARSNAMRYEHLVEINDPFFPLLSPLTREQVWEGLLLRAYAPEEFIYGLDDVVVDEVASDDAATKVLQRVLDFGSFTVRDIVRIHPHRSVHTEVEAGPDWPQSRLVISIEEPEKDRLYLRFVYEWDEAAGSGELDTVTLAIREQAYHAADLDTVARLRRLAEEKLG
jgi:hypothetical protein